MVLLVLMISIQKLRTSRMSHKMNFVDGALDHRQFRARQIVIGPQ